MRQPNTGKHMINQCCSKHILNNIACELFTVWGTRLSVNGVNWQSTLYPHSLSPTDGKRTATKPVEKVLYKSKEDDALKRVTRLVRSFVFTVFDLQSQSRKGVFPSSGIILLQIHPQRTV